MGGACCRLVERPPDRGTERLREATFELGVSQRDVANFAGMNVTNRGNIERGIANPTLDTLVRLSGVTEIDPAVPVAGLLVSDLPATKARFAVSEFEQAKGRGARARSSWVVRAGGTLGRASHPVRHR